MGKLYLLQQGPGGDGATESPAATAAFWTVSDISPVAVPRFASNISIDVSADGQISVNFQSEPGDGGSKLAASVESGAASEDEMRGSDEGDLLAPEAEALDLQVPHGSSAPVKLENPDTAQANDADGEGAEIPGVATVASDDQGAKPDDDTDGGPIAPIVLDVTGEFEIIATPVTVAGGEGDTVAQKKPQVTVTEDGKIAILHVSDGEKPGTSVIEVNLIDDNGNPILRPDGAPATAVVATDAIVEVADTPYLDLGPSISTAGSNVVVAYVSNSGDGEQTQYQLNLQLINDDGEARVRRTNVVALASDPETTYSDFDTAGISSHRHDDDGADQPVNNNSDQAGADDGTASTTVDTDDSAPPSTDGAQVAVVWVENANESGYGSIMGQLFAIVDRESDVEGSNDGGNSSGTENDGDGGQVLVALGRDGSDDANGGDGDGRIPSAVRNRRRGDWARTASFRMR